jgi:hypothetical protein
VEFACNVLVLLCFAAQHRLCSRPTFCFGRIATELEKQMRQTIIVAATSSLITAVVAAWGTTVIIAQAPRTATATPASAPFNVMQMMSHSKNLPVQQCDAF